MAEKEWDGIEDIAKQHMTAQVITEKSCVALSELYPKSRSKNIENRIRRYRFQVVLFVYKLGIFAYSKSDRFPERKRSEIYGYIY